MGTSWIQPTELLQPTPRQFRTKKSFLVICCVQLAVIALLTWIGSTAIMPIRDLQHLKHKGASVAGTVTGTHTIQVHGKHPHVNYYVDYTYRAKATMSGGEVIYHRVGMVYAGDYAKAKTGDSVTVIYDPKLPERAAMANEIAQGMSPHDPPNMPGMNVYLAFGFEVVVIALICFVLFRGYALERALVSYGYATQAFVVSKKEWRGRGGSSVRVTYNFKDREGEMIEAKSRALPAAQVNGFEDNLTVLYDPEDSGRSGLYPLQFVVCVKEER